MLFRLGKIRPELKAYKIGFLLLDIALALGFLISITLVLTAVYLLSVAYCSDFLILLGLAAILFFLNFWLFKKMRVPYLQKMLEASNLIDAGPGETAILCFPGVTGYSGLLLEVRDDNVSAPKIIALGVPKTFKIPNGDLEVILRYDTTGRTSTVVVQIGDRHFAGSAKDHAGMKQEVSRMQLLLSGLFYLSIAAVIGIVSNMYIENNRLAGEIERARASINFPTTEAHIINAGVAKTRIQKGKVKRTVWFPKVSYAYAIDGEHQTGERSSVANILYYDKEAAQKIAAQYPPNSIHPLYYDPADPTFTVLVTGNEEILINDRLMFLIKWSCILVALSALALVFQLCRNKLLPKIAALAK